MMTSNLIEFCEEIGFWINVVLVYVCKCVTKPISGELCFNVELGGISEVIAGYAGIQYSYDYGIYEIFVSLISNIVYTIAIYVPFIFLLDFSILVIVRKLRSYISTCKELKLLLVLLVTMILCLSYLNSFYSSLASIIISRRIIFSINMPYLFNDLAYNKNCFVRNNMVIADKFGYAQVHRILFSESDYNFILAELGRYPYVDMVINLCIHHNIKFSDINVIFVFRDDVLDIMEGGIEKCTIWRLYKAILPPTPVTVVLTTWYFGIFNTIVIVIVCLFASSLNIIISITIIFVLDLSFVIKFDDVLLFTLHFNFVRMIVCKHIVSYKVVFNHSGFQMTYVVNAYSNDIVINHGKCYKCLYNQPFYDLLEVGEYPSLYKLISKLYLLDLGPTEHGVICQCLGHLHVYRDNSGIIIIDALGFSVLLLCSKYSFLMSYSINLLWVLFAIHLLAQLYFEYYTIYNVMVFELISYTLSCFLVSCFFLYCFSKLSLLLVIKAICLVCGEEILVGGRNYDMYPIKSYSEEVTSITDEGYCYLLLFDEPERTFMRNLGPNPKLARLIQVIREREVLMTIANVKILGGPTHYHVVRGGRNSVNITTLCNLSTTCETIIGSTIFAGKYTMRTHCVAKFVVDIRSGFWLFLMFEVLLLLVAMVGAALEIRRFSYYDFGLYILAIQLGYYEYLIFIVFLSLVGTTNRYRNMTADIIGFVVLLWVFTYILEFVVSNYYINIIEYITYYLSLVRHLINLWLLACFSYIILILTLKLFLFLITNILKYKYEDMIDHMANSSGFMTSSPIDKFKKATLINREVVLNNVITYHGIDLDGFTTTRGANSNINSHFYIDPNNSIFTNDMDNDDKEFFGIRSIERTAINYYDFLNNISEFKLDPRLNLNNLNDVRGLLAHLREMPHYPYDYELVQGVKIFGNDRAAATADTKYNKNFTFPEGEITANAYMPISHKFIPNTFVPYGAPQVVLLDFDDYIPRNYLENFRDWSDEIKDNRNYLSTGYISNVTSKITEEVVFTLGFPLKIKFDSLLPQKYRSIILQPPFDNFIMECNSIGLSTSAQSSAVVNLCDVIKAGKRVIVLNCTDITLYPCSGFTFYFDEDMPYCEILHAKATQVCSDMFKEGIVYDVVRGDISLFNYSFDYIVFHMCGYFYKCDYVSRLALSLHCEAIVIVDVRDAAIIANDESYVGIVGCACRKLKHCDVSQMQFCYNKDGMIYVYDYENMVEMMTCCSMGYVIKEGDFMPNRPRYTRAHIYNNFGFGYSIFRSMICDDENSAMRCSARMVSDLAENTAWLRVPCEKKTKFFFFELTKYDMIALPKDFLVILVSKTSQERAGKAIDEYQTQSTLSTIRQVMAKSVNAIGFDDIMDNAQDLNIVKGVILNCANIGETLDSALWYVPTSTSAFESYLAIFRIIYDNLIIISEFYMDSSATLFGTFKSIYDSDHLNLSSYFTDNFIICLMRQLVDTISNLLSLAVNLVILAMYSIFTMDVTPVYNYMNNYLAVMFRNREYNLILDVDMERGGEIIEFHNISDTDPLPRRLRNNVTTSLPYVVVRNLVTEVDVVGRDYATCIGRRVNEPTLDLIDLTKEVCAVCSHNDIHSDLVVLNNYQKDNLASLIFRSPYYADSVLLGNVKFAMLNYMALKDCVVLCSIASGARLYMTTFEEKSITSKQSLFVLTSDCCSMQRASLSINASTTNIEGFGIRIISKNPFLFSVICRHYERSLESGYCFYKNLDYYYSKYLLPGDAKGYCSPMGIIAASCACCVAILHCTISGDFLYYPKLMSIDSIRSVILVVDNHAHVLKVDCIRHLINHVTILDIEKWQLFVGMEFSEVLDKETSNDVKMCLVVDELFSKNSELALISINNKLVTIKARYEQLMTSMYDVSCSARMKQLYEWLLYNLLYERYLYERMLLVYATENVKFYITNRDVYVYDYTNKKFLTKPEPSFPLSAAWDGVSFVRVKSSGNKYYVVIDSEVSMNYKCVLGYLIFCEATEFLKHTRVIEAYDQLIYNIGLTETQRRLDGLVINDFDGVPGCAKTTSIYSRFVSSKALVCTSTVANREEYEIKNGGKNILLRTYDSVVLNRNVQSPIMYCDEAGMEHAGHIMLTALLVNSHTIYTYKDSLQIPFISRIADFEPKYHILLANSTTRQWLTYRLPIVMIKVLVVFYPMIKTFSVEKGLIHVEKIMAGIVPYMPKVQLIMTFTQVEKLIIKEQLKGTECNVLTIHEAEGQSHVDVVLIRLTHHENEIYDSLPHCIVGITRHKRNIYYYTPIEDDTVSKILTMRFTALEIQNTKLASKMRMAMIPNCLPPLRGEKLIHLGDGGEKVNTSWFSSILAMLYNTYSYKPQVKYTYYLPNFNCVNNYVAGPDLVYVNNCLSICFNLNTEVYDQVKYALTWQTIDYSIFDRINPVRLSQAVGNKRSERVSPKLITPQPKPVANNLINTFQAVLKRNYNPPHVNNDRLICTVKQVVDKFIETYINPDKVNAFTEAEFDYESLSFLNAWAGKRTTAQITNLNRAILLDHTDRDSYSCSIKSDAKPKLDNSHGFEIPTSQVITAPDPVHTAKISGQFSCFAHKLRFMLKDKWLISDGVSVEEQSGFINKILCGVSECLLLEVDFSKFDKSQEDLILTASCAILLRLGMPKYVVHQYFDDHLINRLKFPNLGVMLKTHFQRRSGENFTLMGNTIVSMMVLCFTYNLEEAYGGLFVGDDSLVFISRLCNFTPRVTRTSDVFNLVSKIVTNNDAPFYTGKLLLHVRGCWLLVPDPIKALVKLGRSDLYCKEHVLLYYTSFSDVMHLYKDNDVRNKLKVSCLHRYAGVLNVNINIVEIFIDFLASLVFSKSKFVNCFYARPLIWERRLPALLKESILKNPSLSTEVLEGILADMEYAA